MSKYEKMTKSLERMQEIRGGVTQNVLEYSKLVEEQTEPIKNDIDLRSLKQRKR